jgi:hypothetical protein
MAATPDTTTPLSRLLNTARDAHRAIGGADTLGSLALRNAFVAGDALIAAKARVNRGEWAATLEQTGIPSSTARLYMRLARHRDQIIAAGCKSISGARDLLTDRKPPRRARRTGSRTTAAPEPEPDDRYEEGYAAGYTKGRADERAARGGARRNGHTWTPTPADLKWVLRRVHPDVVDGNDSLKATRAAQWLNQLLEQAR